MKLDFHILIAKATLVVWPETLFTISVKSG